ncbi:exodeoxyribonuclease VII small subunit [Brevundimonas sp. 2R-24]|uniref:Exodeoxyribonuclease 7 small subunit n=1 Tax=Peiella sedimenti TaxID=3061083 RepID=A0ABT8SQ56_9CAUL|nr:exodeoxyribonuclease VII small subunit [Caulobacteraceae bacterium XZ-24]
MSDTQDVSALSFEEALAQLERIVAELESGQAPLERSVEIYTRGAALKAHCEQRLNEARLRVEKIMVGPDGKAAGAEPADFS